MPCREYPEKSFISFSPSANTLPADIPAERYTSRNVSAEKYPSGKPIPQESEEPPIRLKDSNLQLKNSRAQSFSRNTDRQGICEQAEAFEGFFGVFSIEHDSDQIVIAKRKNDIATTTLPTRMQVLHPCRQ